MTASPDGRSIVVVTDLRAAAAVVDRAQVRFLVPFMEAARSVTEAAARLDVDRDFLLPRVRRLHRLGLVRVERTRARKGRPVKVYRASADEFFVPLELISVERGARSSETYWHAIWWQACETVLLDAARAASRPGARVTLGRAGVTITLATEPGRAWDASAPTEPALAYGWRALRLTPERAKRLQGELHDLVRRYQETPDVDGQRFVVGMHLAPLPDRVGTEAL